jgi:uncharacterized phage-associated protein
MNKIAEIDLKRIANILVFFANKTENFGVTKANKMLYYLDCFHLLRYGRTVIKDKYIKDQLGPVPIETYRKLNVIQELSYFPENDKREFNADHELLFEYIEIILENIGSTRPLAKIAAKKDFEPIWFSESEREIMDELSQKYCSATATDLVRQTHKELPYKNANKYEFIDLKLFLKEHNRPQSEIDHAAYTERLINAISKNYQ